LIQLIYCAGAIREVQGYEGFCLLWLINEEGIAEEDIFNCPTEMPDIRYINPSTKKESRYFPDIYIQNRNLIIEVKSMWTFEQNIDVNKAKVQATAGAGYEIEVHIFDGKGELLMVLDSNAVANYSVSKDSSSK
jgi:hypothetical protein